VLNALTTWALLGAALATICAMEVSSGTASPVALGLHRRCGCWRRCGTRPAQPTWWRYPARRLLRRGPRRTLPLPTWWRCRYRRRETRSGLRCWRAGSGARRLGCAGGEARLGPRSSSPGPAAIGVLCSNGLDPFGGPRVRRLVRFRVQTSVGHRNTSATAKVRM
jgi:hypothetical protein